MKRLTCSLIALTIAFTISVGCGDSGTKSVTDGLDQSAIDEYKANEAKLEQETMEESMDLE